MKIMILSKPMKYVATLGLILGNIGFFYFFSIDLKAALLASLYFLFAAGLPGYLIATWFHERFHSNSGEKPPWHLMVGLSTMFGIGNVLLSYFMLQVLRSDIWKYFCLLPYLFLIKYVFRLRFRSWCVQTPCRIFNLNNWLVPSTLFFILLVNLLVFLMRPTPGILPLDIFHDHLWNAGNTASLVNGFPLKSMNIETKPFIAYHVLVHILGAHMAMVTGLTAHLTGLQYIFIPLIPFLILNMIAFLYGLDIRKNGYLIYGLCVLLFGGGFAIVHEVKINSLLNSSTNFLGVILLFAVMTITVRLRDFGNYGRFVLPSLGVFLATAAKGSVGTALICGALVWTIYKLFKKSIDMGDWMECFGALLGFLSAYFLFFIFPVFDQESVKGFVGKSSFPILPFSYVVKNALASPIIEIIYKYLPSIYQSVAHFVLILVMAPVHLLLYYTYRLLIVYELRIRGIEEPQKRILSVIVGSLVITYSINMNPQEHAYFLNSALFLLDVLFIFYVNKESLFSKVKGYYSKKEIFALTGACFILVLPFLSLNGWIRQEYLYNFVMYGKLGQHFDSKLKKTQYRQSHQSITPEIYECLEYIRKNGDRHSVIVSPFVDLEDGRHLAFYTSAFGERPVFLEGYDFGGVVKYTGLLEIKRRIEILEGIYKEYSVPEEMHTQKYLFIIKRSVKNEYEIRYFVDTLFENAEWSVVRIG